MSKKPLIIKVGSSTVMTADTHTNVEFLEKLMSLCRDLHQEGYAPLLVVSGAVAHGNGELGDKAPLQARAARGQLLLTANGHAVAKKHELRLAQFLLSREDIIDRTRYTGMRDTLQWCIEHDVVPFLNENDATSPQGTHDFVDNDQLAIIVGMAVHAERMFLLTNVAGVYQNGPSENNESGLIQEIADVNQVLMEIHTSDKHAIGRGGIATKLHAARLASFVGIGTHIISSVRVEEIPNILSGRARIGTRCLPWPKPLTLTDRNRWLLATHTSNASMLIDQGAVAALRKRKSLLAVGIRKVFGHFIEGDSVEVIGDDYRPIAFGIVDMGSKELHKALTGREKPFDVEVIHADKLILFPS